MEQIEAALKKIDAIGDDLLKWALDGRTQCNPFREQGWPLAEFRHAIIIVLAYLTFVFVGRKVMLPDSVQPVGGLYMYKFFYNITQVMLCSWMSIQALVVAWQNNYTFIPCNNFVGSVCGSSNTNLPPMGFVLYIFYISKILDFADTVFIVLGKKWDQLIFLHYYHHASIFLFYWYNLNAGYDGDVYLTIVLNGLIHAIMYTYYFVSMHTSDKIWWKPALTMGQMIQFVCMNVQAGYLIYIGCTKFPINIVRAYLYYILSLLVLFGQFAVKEYLPKEYNRLRKLVGLAPIPEKVSSTNSVGKKKDSEKTK